MLAATRSSQRLVPLAALAGSRAMHPELGAKLVGTVEVPKGAPKGHGIVNLTLNATKGTVCWTFAGITGIGKRQPPTSTRPSRQGRPGRRPLRRRLQGEGLHQSRRRA